KAERRLLELVDGAAIVMLASHDQELLRRVCNRIVPLDRGRIVGAEGGGETDRSARKLEEICA
ncbi:MAG: ABC transporter ATP-binding protein, partial [Bradyrhizobium sp.]|nr:ABC transporter ATP-binding protein [Bradyrhizobium sp.]